MLTRNSNRVVNKINNASPTLQCTVASCKTMLSAMLNTKMYELATSTVARLRLDTDKRWFISEVQKPDNDLNKKFARYNITYPETLDVPKPSRLLVSIVSIPKRVQIADIGEIFMFGDSTNVYLNPEMTLLEYS